MPRVAVRTGETAFPCALPEHVHGAARAQAYFAEGHALHLHLLDIAPRAALEFSPQAAARTLHVWQGGLRAGDVALPAGSSLVIEGGAHLSLSADAAGACALLFAEAASDPSLPADGGGGGAVHLLPAARVARHAPDPGGSGTHGGLHFDARCPGCRVWLHENTMPGMDDASAAQLGQRGVHAHSEAEIIFVTQGTIRLGQKLHGPGTALAIAADTFYGFTPGPDGLSFVNFRPSPPRAFRMLSGGEVDEALYWRQRVSPPDYLTL